jgi:hypothetical protein
MKRLSILAATLVCATSAMAGWTERMRTDRLTDRKVVRMENAALASVDYYGRAIVPKLILQCITASEGSTYLGAFISFGDQVAIADAKIRYRFDNGVVETRLAGISDHGDYFEIVAADQEFLDELARSSRLRVELALLAGAAFMEFNTKGSDVAIAKAGCS